MDIQDINPIFQQTIAASVGSQAFGTWFGETRYELADGHLRVISYGESAPFRSNWLKNNWAHRITDACLSIFGEAYPLDFRFETATVAAEVSSPSVSRTPSKVPLSQGNRAPVARTASQVAPRLVSRPISGTTPSPSQEGSEVPQWGTFESFVMGHSNREAKQIMELAIRRPNDFNLLFICGPTSVGKSHLLEAAYSDYKSRGGRKKPLFLTADQFTTLFTQSVRPGGERQPFLDRFKNISLLAIDDLHFLEGKIKTQFELIGLIDQLRRQKVQMIFSADRPLSALAGIRSELIARLQSGVVCSIKQAERETLLEIFLRAARRIQLPVSEEVARVVVSRYATHARQLFGIANQLCARYLTTGRAITVETVEEILEPFGGSQRMVKIEDIERIVAELFGVKPSALRGKSRAQEYAYPRMLAMWLARKHTRSALSEIGRYFGNRTHSTVVSSQKRVDALLERVASDPSVGEKERRTAENIQRIERLLIG